MKTQARKLYEQCKMKSIKKLYKQLLVIIIGMLTLFMGVSIYAILKGNLILSLVFGGCAITIVLAFLIVPHIILNTPFKEINVNNIQIGTFIESSIGLGKKYAIIHLIINGKEYSKGVRLKDYRIESLYGSLLKSAAIIEFFMDYNKDKKYGKHIAILTKKHKGQTIAAVYHKYSNKLAIVVDDKIF